MQEQQERIGSESISHVIRRFQRVGFEGLKAEELAIAVGTSEFRDAFHRQTGVDWSHKYEMRAMERLKKAHFDMQWMSARAMEEFTPFLAAVVRGDLPKTKDFLRNCSDIDLARGAVDAQGRSALHIAAKEGHGTILDFLLLQEFNVHARDKSLKTPLHYAGYHGYEYLCEQLVKQGALVESADSKGRSAFHLACSGGSVKAVVFLIGVCPEIVNVTDNDELSGLHYAALNVSAKAVEITRTLLDFGADVNSRDRDGRTPLYVASETGKTRVIPLLLSKGADASAACYTNQKTSLDVAANDHTRELIIVYTVKDNIVQIPGGSAAQRRKEETDLKWMDEAIKGKSLKKEVPFSDSSKSSKSKQRVKTILKEEENTIAGWVREKFFEILKKVQEEGVLVNQHLKKPFVYTGSWMEGIANVEDLYNFLQTLTPTEACLCSFNLLCPYDKALPTKEDDGEKETIDAFFGDAWQAAIKQPAAERLKKEIEMQEKLARLDEIEMKLNYKDKILKDKIEELKKLRQQNIDLQVQVQEMTGGVPSKTSGGGIEATIRIEELVEELRVARGELKEKSRQLVEKDMELELAKLEVGGTIGGGTIDGVKMMMGNEEMKELVILREDVRRMKMEEKMNRFKTGQIFLRAINEKKVVVRRGAGGGGGGDDAPQNVENLQDDEAIISMYMALRNNPPNFITRLKEVDKDGDNRVNQTEFIRYCSGLGLASQDIISLQRIAGFFEGKQLLGIAEFKTILENRPKQRQIWEERLFRRVITAIESKKLTIKKFFALIDADGSGDITPNELRQGFENLKIILNQKDFNSLFCIFDKDKNNSISLPEMKEILHNYLQPKGEEGGAGEEQEEGQEESEEDPLTNDICREENKVFLVEEKKVSKELNTVNGSLKLQLPTLRGIDGKQKNIFLKITLAGSVEETIVHQTQMQDSFIKVAQKFRFNKATVADLSRFLSIQLFSSQSMSEESFIGETHFAWKGCLSDPNEWHCNQEFTLISITFPKKKVTGFLAVQARFIPQNVLESQPGRVDIADANSPIDRGVSSTNNTRAFEDQQRKYIELQKEYMKQQQEFMRLQQQQQLRGNQTNTVNGIAGQPAIERVEANYKQGNDDNEISSNLSKLLDREDFEDKSEMMAMMDSDIDFLTKGGRGGGNEKKNNHHTKDLNFSMNSDIENIMGTSGRMGDDGLNPEDLANIDSNVDLSLIYQK